MRRLRCICPVDIAHHIFIAGTLLAAEPNRVTKSVKGCTDALFF